MKTLANERLIPKINLQFHVPFFFLKCLLFAKQLGTSRRGMSRFPLTCGRASRSVGLGSAPRDEMRRCSAGLTKVPRRFPTAAPNCSGWYRHEHAMRPAPPRCYARTGRVTSAPRCTRPTAPRHSQLLYRVCTPTGILVHAYAYTCRSQRQHGGFDFFHSSAMRARHDDDDDGLFDFCPRRWGEAS
jgi:hypothetical protein